ncbi:MAG: TolC family protein [Ectothiorhodospiraceae bacterium]|nr:TolC family protein [Chromatiales bacterium]MCP5157284.1 TolC family protein [Ectothiorhodospiraceae bacterium]
MPRFERQSPCSRAGARASRPWWLVLAAAGVIAGCANPRHPALDRIPESRVRTIAPLDPATIADQPPITLEEAEREPRAPLAPPTPPPERLELAIEDVRKHALENNLELKVELVRPSIAQAQRREAEAAFEPSVLGGANVGEQDQLPLALGAPGRRVDSGQVEFGVRVPLRTGGTATVSMPLIGTNPDLPGVPNTYDSQLAFSISQPLLRNAGIAVNTSTITIASLQERQQDARAKVAAMRVLADVENAYWSLYAASRSLEVRYEQYQRGLEQERQARRLFEEGAVPEIEIWRASGGVSQRVEQVIVAENRRRQAERALKRIMNVPDVTMESPTSVFTLTQPAPVRLRLSRDKAIGLAMDNRMELLDLELQLAIDAVTVDVAKNQKLPLLTLDYDFAYRARGRTVADSIDTVTRRDFTDWRVGATLEVPLGNSAARARYRQALLQRVLTLSSLDSRRSFVRQEILDALDNLETSWQRILAARQETLLAARTYEGERRQFLAGTRTSTDVLQAETALAEAQLREVEALASYELAKVDLAIATGTMLGKGNVALEPYRIPPGSVFAERAAVRGEDWSRQMWTAESSTSSTAERVVERKLEQMGVELARTPSQPGAAATGAAPPSEPASGEPSALARWPASAYTLQLVGGLDEAQARRFVETSDLGPETAVFGAEIGGRLLFAVVHGAYDSRAEARHAAESLPPSARRGEPWVRQVSDVLANRVR